MKTLVQRFGNLAALLSGAVLVLGDVVLDWLRNIHPDWFCQAVNPGGKEFFCGPDYSIPEIVTFTHAILFTSIGLYYFGLAALFRNNLRRSGALGLLVTTILLFAIFAFKYAYRNEDTP